MKIITSEAVYIQKRDIGLLNRGLLPLPLSLVAKISDMEIDATNKEDYVSFDTPHEVFFINNLACLIDYSDIVNLSIEEIDKLIRQLVLSKDAAKLELDQATSLNSVKLKEWNIEVINHKLETLTTVKGYKMRNIPIPLPEDLGDLNRPTNGIHPNGFMKSIKRS